MADELDGTAHPDPETIHAPPERKRPARRRRHRWLPIVALVLCSVQVMPYLGLLSPVLSPLIFVGPGDPCLQAGGAWPLLLSVTACFG